jgi:hypothetical protein
VSLERGVAVVIVRVNHAGRYRLELVFSDGHVSTVDFGPFLRGTLNPETRRFLDEKRFRSFSLTNGTLVWGDHEMCFSIEDLYEGRIGRKEPASKGFAVAEAGPDYVTKKKNPAGLPRVPRGSPKSKA